MAKNADTMCHPFASGCRNGCSRMSLNSSSCLAASASVLFSRWSVNGKVTCKSFCVSPFQFDGIPLLRREQGACTLNPPSPYFRGRVMGGVPCTSCILDARNLEKLYRFAITPRGSEQKIFALTDEDKQSSKRPQPTPNLILQAGMETGEQTRPSGEQC